MRILGVDPGLNIAGFCFLDTQKKNTTLAAYGVIKSNNQFSLPKRLKYLHEETDKIIKKFEPDVLAIEDAFYSKNFKSAMTLGHARGTIILTAAMNNMIVREYAPRKVKSSVCGSGSASKKQVSYMVSKILKLDKELKPYDISDAIAVGLCFINQEGIK
jgi:crossover junction endodeoxyribonuclease RuvC